MVVSNRFAEYVKSYAEKKRFTILYDSYERILILYDELGKCQYDLYDIVDIDKDVVVFDKMRKLRGYKE